MSVLHVERREAGAKAKLLRKAGIIPMALVEKGGATHLIQAPEKEVRHALAHASGAGMLEVEVGGEKKHSAILKIVDRDIITRSITHVTLMLVSMDDTVKTDLPVVALGAPALVESGEAVISNPTSAITVRGKVSDMPDHVEIDVSGLTIGDSVSAGQAQLPEGLELMSSPDAVLFTVQPPAELVIEEEPTEEGEAAEGGEEAAPEGESEGEGESA
jgi:large subunit ribosomal protein L25